MEHSALLNFLSEDSVLAHLSYQRELRARLSLLKKYYPSFANNELWELISSIHGRVPAELFSCALACFLHESYFSSFTTLPSPCPEVKKYYSSENAFCYELLSAARKLECGFVYALRDRRGRVNIVSDPFCAIPISSRNVLALDVSEHAYFSDYGFNKDEYLRRALAYLNLSKLFSEDGKTS